MALCNVELHARNDDDAPTLLVRQQEGHLACKKLGVGLLIATI